MRRYEKYKDSGVEWIGEIPEHWEVKRVKHVLKSLNNIRVPLSSEERGKMVTREFDYYGASGVIDLVEDYLFDEPLLLIGEDGANLYSRSTKLAFIAKGKYWVNNHAHILKPTYGLLEYYCELLERIDYTVWITGSAQPKLTSENLMNIQILVPPIEDQKEIVQYINHKTAEIDALITDKKRLLELYEEEKMAIINEAVTKGVASTRLASTRLASTGLASTSSATRGGVKMKDSGIEWMGEIPAHWEVKRLKYVIKIYSGEGLKSEEIKENGLFPVYGGNGILGYTESYNSIDTEIIIGRVGAKCGNVRLVSGNKWISDNALVGTIIGNVDPTYITIQMQNMDLNKMANQNAQPLITGTMIKEQFSFFPPIEEQKQIVEYIEAETKRIDTKKEKTQKLIDLLTEYRTALISEVVTGKVKVV